MSSNTRTVAVPRLAADSPFANPYRWGGMIEQAAIKEISALRHEFWENVLIPGDASYLNQNLERAGRVADFMEFAELMARDALNRNESCGGHFREEYQTPDGEALRDDEDYSYVSAWEWNGLDKEPILNKESLDYEFIHRSQRSYK